MKTIMDSEIQKKVVSDADLLRDLMRHPGMDLMREYIDALTKRKHDAWLLADPEEAEKIRADTRGYGLFLNLVKQRIIAGDEVRKMQKANE